jgi:hypothetical protein
VAIVLAAGLARADEKNGPKNGEPGGASTANCGTANGSKRNEPPLKARLALAQAYEAGKLQRWQDAYIAASNAIQTAPDWGEPYFVMAGAIMSATPNTTAQQLAQGISADCTMLTERFTSARDALTRYLELTHDARDARRVEAAIGDLNERLQICRDRIEQTAQTSKGLVRTPDGHWCYPGQTWRGACVGAATRCPAGFTPDASRGCAKPAGDSVVDPFAQPKRSR